MKKSDRIRPWLTLCFLVLVASQLTAQPKYRTFNQIDLSGKKAKAGKILAASACFAFPDTFPGVTLTSLHVKFNAEITSIEDSGGFTITLDHKGKTLNATGRTVSNGQTVTICATFRKKNLDVRVENWQWDTNGVKFGQKFEHLDPTTITAIQRQPNGGNVREYLYKRVITRPDGIVIGVPDTGSVGWIRYKKADAKYFPHSGPPRCFDRISQDDNRSKPFIGELKNPHVKKQNNNLLGEVHALVLAVIANDSGVTQPDTPATRLGDIIYNDGSNPLDPCNGKTIRQVILLADTALTYCSRFDSAFYVHLDTCVTRINAAFDGPYVAVSFNPFELAGTHTIGEYPYLHPNPGAAPVVVSHRGSSILEQGPSMFALDQNFPNPFNPVTTIRFSIPVASTVTLKVYNLLGQEVSTILDRQELEEGEQSVEFNAAGLTSGVYFYRIIAQTVESGNVVSSVRRMILAK